MTEKTKRKQAVITNLIDTGCNFEQVERFMKLLAGGVYFQQKPGAAIVTARRAGSGGLADHAASGPEYGVAAEVYPGWNTAGCDGACCGDRTLDQF